VVAGLEKKNGSCRNERRRSWLSTSRAMPFVASTCRMPPVHRISIIPRGIAALGYTLQLPHQERLPDTKSELLDRLAVLLGGRVARDHLREISTGLTTTSSEPRTSPSMVKEYGMSDNWLCDLRKGEEASLPGHLPDRRPRVSEERPGRSIVEVKKIVDETYERVETILISKKRN